MPTPQLTDHLRRLRRDTEALAPCRHPECAAYRLSLIEQIGIVVRLIENAQKTEATMEQSHSTISQRFRPKKCNFPISTREDAHG